MDPRSLEVIIIVIGQLGLAIVYIVTTRMWVTFHGKRLDAHDKSHQDHYNHAASRSIHQESMDAKLIDAHFHEYKNQLNQHISDDLRLFTEIRQDLKDIREAVQDVRENMPKHSGEK